jgi:hypothetical protein
MPKMERDQQILELLPSAHYISSCKTLASHPQPLPGRCWILPMVLCVRAVTNPLNLLRNPANHPSDLPSNQQNQCSKYGSEPRFVSQIVCNTTQEPRDGPWHCPDLVPQYNERMYGCKVVVVVRNGRVVEG